MPSYEDIVEMDAHMVFERVVDLKPETVYLLLNDLRDILKIGSFPMEAFYTVKNTDAVLKGLLDPREQFTTKNETN
jgi:hypothetical protein